MIAFGEDFYYVDLDELSNVFTKYVDSVIEKEAVTNLNIKTDKDSDGKEMESQEKQIQMIVNYSKNTINTFLTNCIEIVMEEGFNNPLDEDEKINNSENNISYTIAFNTLLKYKIIKNINDE